MGKLLKHAHRAGVGVAVPIEHVSERFDGSEVRVLAGLPIRPRFVAVENLLPTTDEFNNGLVAILA